MVILRLSFEAVMLSGLQAAKDLCISASSEPATLKGSRPKPLAILLRDFQPRFRAFEGVFRMSKVGFSLAVP